MVVPTRNRARILALTLRSILTQRGVEVDVVVVDEGSSDGTADYLAALAAADDRVRVVRHDPPKGLPAARNAGLALASTPWVAFCDDDDVWSPEKLASQLGAMADSGAGWSCVGSVLVDTDLAVIDQQRAPAADEMHELLLEHNVVPGGGSGVVARTDLVREVGGFDETLRASEDWDMWIRLAAAEPVASVDRPLVGYRIWPGSMSSEAERMRTSRRVVLDRYGGTHDPEWERYAAIEYERFVARQLVRGGNRLAAARTYAAAALRHRSPLQLGRAPFALVAPALLDRIGTARALHRIPGPWLDEAESWLEPLREQAAA